MVKGREDEVLLIDGGPFNGVQKYLLRVRRMGTGLGS